MCTKLLANKNIQTTSSINTNKYNENQMIYQIINGVQNEITHEYLLT